MMTEKAAMASMQNQFPMISAEGLTKRFDEVLAVDQVTFDVQQGELFGFLGPNGAGKTTTINLLIGLARPDSGAIRIGGLDCAGNPKAIQHLLGVVPDESNLYPELSGFDNLCFCASLYGMRKGERQTRARELLQSFGLSEAANRKFAVYSKGMKRKLTIAAGIIHNPPILFLDEPTTGIDVASARQIRQLIANFHNAGTTIFLTTHYIEEAERLCDRIAFIVRGRIVRVDSVSDLLRPIQDKHVLLISTINPDAVPTKSLCEAFPQLNIQTLTDGQMRIESPKPIQVGPLVAFLDEQGANVLEARLQRLTLEDVFVNITGIEAEAMKKDKGAGNA